jgi:hypothetical protein
MKRSLCLLLLFASTAFAQESYDQLLRHWDYDQKAPLAIQEAGVQDREGVKIHDLSYAVPTGDRAASLGPNGGRAAAYLVVPPGKGPFPAGPLSAALARWPPRLLCTPRLGLPNAHCLLGAQGLAHPRCRG